MIVVRVELWSARDGSVSELARMQICNVGGTEELGNYAVSTLHGRSKEQLDRAMTTRHVTHVGRVEAYARKRLHVWNLVAKALSAMRYGE